MKKTNVLHLMSDLYNKQLLGTKIKITNTYDYSDVQEIKVTEKSYSYDDTYVTFEYIYHNVPTKCGYLDTYKISEILK